MAVLLVVTMPWMTGCDKDGQSGAASDSGVASLDPLALLVLDVSSSMDDNDPANCQLLAARQFLELARIMGSDPDQHRQARVGIILFGSVPWLLMKDGTMNPHPFAAGSPSTTLISDQEISACFAEGVSAIPEFERNEWHTDYNAALAAVKRTLEALGKKGQLPKNPVTILMSDGALWPYPGNAMNYDEPNNPFAAKKKAKDYISYYEQKKPGCPIAITPQRAGGFSYDGKKEVQCKSELLSYVETLVLGETIPAFRENNWPLYTIGLGSADLSLLKRMAEQANPSAKTPRYLSAGDGADQPLRFNEILADWLDLQRYPTTAEEVRGTADIAMDHTLKAAALCVIASRASAIPSKEDMAKAVILTGPDGKVIQKSDQGKLSVYYDRGLVIYAFLSPMAGIYKLKVAGLPADTVVRQQLLYRSDLAMEETGIADICSSREKVLYPQVRLLDGRGEMSLKDTFSAIDARAVATGTSAPVEVVLNDEGLAGDTKAGDNRLGGMIPLEKVGIGRQQLFVTVKGRFISGEIMTPRTVAKEFKIVPAIDFFFPEAGEERVTEKSIGNVDRGSLK